VVNWLEKNVLANIGSSILFSCFIISCVPSNNKLINAQTQMQLGLTYIQLHQYDLAEKQLQQAVLSKKNYFDGLRTLAYLYQLMKKPEKAGLLYHKMIQKYPTSSKIYNNYGVFLCQQKEYPKAILAFNMALKYDPENKEIQKNLHRCTNIKEH